MSAADSSSLVRVYHVRHELHALVFLLRWLDFAGRRERTDERVRGAELLVFRLRFLPTETGKKASEGESNPRQAVQHANQGDGRRALSTPDLRAFYGAVSGQLLFLLRKPERFTVLLTDRDSR